MKHILLALIFGLVISGTYAQSADTVKTNPSKKGRFSIKVDYHLPKKDSVSHVSKAPGFSFKLTFARFDIGFSKLVDNGGFSLSPANSFLSNRPWKTSNVGFDILQFGYRFGSYFKIYLSGGFDWTHIRLRNDITILRNQPTLTYTTDAVHYEKNRFSSSYLRIPLSFEIRSKDDKDGKKFTAVFGPEAGFLINGRVKQKSKDNGKQKFNDDYHFSQFRYGGFGRIGYGGAGLYVKYYANDMFENSAAQAGLKNMSFGLMIGF